MLLGGLPYNAVAGPQGGDQDVPALGGAAQAHREPGVRQECTVLAVQVCEERDAEVPDPDGAPGEGGADPRPHDHP